MSAVAADLSATTGFVVSDSGGRVLGRVECPMYGSLPTVPDALSVIDPTAGVVALRVAREAIRCFL